MTDEKKKIKYHFLTGDHSGKNPPRTLEFEGDDQAIAAAKKAGDVIRIQHGETLKYVYDKPAEEAQAKKDAADKE
jgi:hypothetical protein